MNNENFCYDSATELVILQMIISLSLAKNLNSYEQNLFGNFLQAIGENLCMIAAANPNNNNCNTNNAGCINMHKE